MDTDRLCSDRSYCVYFCNRNIYQVLPQHIFPQILPILQIRFPRPEVVRPYSGKWIIGYKLYETKMEQSGLIVPILIGMVRQHEERGCH